MWAWINVYNYDSFVGSFYEHRDNLLTKQDIVKAVNKEYGIGNWSRYTLEY